jgi:sirohydrochlorin cobaltochelatase
LTRAILCASFGTADIGALARSADAIRHDVESAFPGAAVAYAFTNETIIAELEKHGAAPPSVEQSLERLKRLNVESLTVQPVFLLRGFEYEQLCRTIEKRARHFKYVRIAAPLLSSEEDLSRLASLLAAQYPASEGRGLALMGHGSDHAAGVAYQALADAFANMGRQDIFVGVTGGCPDFDSAYRQIAGSGLRRIVLAPLTIAAGRHVRRDMAGEAPSSWKSRLEGRGIAVECILRGLTEIEGVRRIFVEHILY